MRTTRFSQVDVFSSTPYGGNPVAIVHDADGMSDEAMQRFAAWTNLSETTFLLAASTPEADYRVRIFTASHELPFAGHPTLGTAHAWLEAGGVPRGDDVVQECAAGLVTVRRGETLAFAAPPLTRSGPADAATQERLARALRLEVSNLLEVAWIDNGPGWVGVRLADADAVLAVDIDPVLIGDLKIGLVGPYDDAAQAEHGCAVEVRALYGLEEDPVTGSLNAGIGQWLTTSGELPHHYVASQGTRMGRVGRVHVDVLDGQVWVGGATATRIAGTVHVDA